MEPAGSPPSQPRRRGRAGCLFFLVFCIFAPVVLRYQLPGYLLFGLSPINVLFYFLWGLGVAISLFDAFNPRFRFGALRTLFVLLAAGALAFTMQYRRVMRNLDFETYLPKRTAAVADWTRGKWGPQDGDFALGPAYRGATDQGKMLVRKRGAVFYAAFPILRWGVGNSENFVYSSDGSVPPDDLFPNRILRVERLGGHWLFVAFH